MKTDTCSKCGSPLEPGQLSINASPLWEIVFKPHSTESKGVKRFLPSSQEQFQRIQAFACLSCGHIELLLQNHHDHEG